MSNKNEASTWQPLIKRQAVELIGIWHRRGFRGLDDDRQIEKIRIDR